MASRGIAKQILGTFVAVLSGWFAAMLFLEASTLIEVARQPHYVVPAALWVAPISVTIVMAYFVIPVWVILLIPLYLFVPESSVLWRLPVCSVCGAIAGLVIVGVWIGGVPGLGDVAADAWGLYLIAALVGGVTCFTGALTRHVFKRAI